MEEQVRMKLKPGTLYEYRPKDVFNRPYGVPRLAIYLGFYKEANQYYDEDEEEPAEDSWAVYKFIDVATGGKYTIEIGLEPWSALSSKGESIIFHHYHIVPV